MLVGSIVQEINQPLAAMVSNGNAGLRWLAKDTPDVQRARITLKNIVRAGLRAGEIVDRIRAISKEESCLRAPVNLNDLVREALVLVENELQDHHIAVRSTLDEMIPKVLADRVQLQHVILNLIKNAIEAMGSVIDGQRFLHIETNVTCLMVALAQASSYTQWQTLAARREGAPNQRRSRIAQLASRPAHVSPPHHKLTAEERDELFHEFQQWKERSTHE